jgi:hypothetical protein
METQRQVRPDEKSCPLRELMVTLLSPSAPEVCDPIGIDLDARMMEMDVI